MSAKLSVIFYIVLCLEIGLVLTLMPWIPQGFFGLSDWSNNYFLLYAARRTGFYGLQAVIASDWVRGAVTGVGVLNLGIAFWEIFNFKQTVGALQREVAAPQIAGDRNPPTADAAGTARTADLPNHEGRNNSSDNSLN